MMIEVIYHAFSLDLGWFIDLFVNNLMWIFLMYAAIYFLKGGKDTIRQFIVVYLVVFGTMDLAPMAGLYFYVAEALMLVYLMRLAAIALLENSPRGSKYIGLAWVLTFFVAVFIYNIFMV